MFNRLRFTLVLCCLCVGAYASQVKQTQIDPMMADAIDFFKTYQDLKDLGFSLETLSPDQRKTLERGYGEDAFKREAQIKYLFAYYCMSQYNLHWSSPEYDKQIVKAFHCLYGTITEDDMRTLRSTFGNTFERKSTSTSERRSTSALRAIPFFPRQATPILLKNRYFPAQGQSEFRFWYTLSDENWDALKDEFLSFAQAGIRKESTTLDTLRSKSWDTILPLKYSSRYHNVSTILHRLFGYFTTLQRNQKLLLKLAFQSKIPSLNQYAEQRFTELVVRETKALHDKDPDDLLVFNHLFTRLSDMHKGNKSQTFMFINTVSTDPHLLNADEKKRFMGVASFFIPLSHFLVGNEKSGWCKYMNAVNEDQSNPSFQKWNRLFEQVNHPLRVTETGELLLPKSEVETIEAYPKDPPRRGSRRQRPSSPAQPQSEVTK